MQRPHLFIPQFLKMIKKAIFSYFLFVFGFLQAELFLGDDIETTGDILQLIIPTSAFVTTFIIDDKSGRKEFYKSFFSTVLITHSLKSSINKPRPNKSANNSFPSGHTSAAFQGASFIHYRYGFKYAWPAYIGASFVGYSRVNAKKHFNEDVIAGALIGILSSFYLISTYNIQVNVAKNYFSFYFSW